MPWKAFNLRMPSDLKARLEEAAHQNQRSLNSEIVRRLWASLDGWRSDRVRP